MESWRYYFPDYEIIQWNETNYDVSKIPYTREAYNEKKYAFVSDYARFDILFQYGGIYFDTDVEVLKSFYIIISEGPFLGMETYGRINPGIGCAFSAGHPLTGEILEFYRNLDYFYSINNNLTVTDFTTNIFIGHGFIQNNSIQKIAGITIYPSEYFSPIDYDTHYLQLTSNSLSIHHGYASWVDRKRKITAIIHLWLCRIFGKEKGSFISSKVRKTAKSAYYFLFKKAS
jgi:mannosyltransferase OCH1-like enzyme